MQTNSDFDAKPMVMLLGQYSTGKTTFIKHLLKSSYPGELYSHLVFIFTFSKRVMGSFYHFSSSYLQELILDLSLQLTDLLLLWYL